QNVKKIFPPLSKGKIVGAPDYWWDDAKSRGFHHAPALGAPFRCNLTSPHRSTTDSVRDKVLSDRVLVGMHGNRWGVSIWEWILWSMHLVVGSRGYIMHHRSPT